MTGIKTKLLYLRSEKEKERSRRHLCLMFKEKNSMASNDKLDKVDIQILQALQENARLTMKEIAARVSLSSTPVFERWKRLERQGYIKKYTVILDEEKLHRGFTVFCKVRLSHINNEVAGRFTQAVTEMPQVSECYNISGAYDYMLKINVPDMKTYKDFLLNVLGKVENVASLESVFVMDEIKHIYGVPLPEVR